jgi:hypothetical protein
MDMRQTSEKSVPPDDRWEEPTAAASAPVSEAMREYAARRCHICQCRFPTFGFGLPLTGRTLWSCMPHRDEVDRLVSSKVPQPIEQGQPALFTRKPD